MKNREILNKIKLIVKTFRIKIEFCITKRRQASFSRFPNLMSVVEKKNKGINFGRFEDNLDISGQEIIVGD